MRDCEGKVALVTGGGRGIGEASCRLLASAGAKVVVADIDIDAAASVAKSIVDVGGEAIAFELDVSSEECWIKAYETTLKIYTQFDVLVNNAGVGVATECKDLSLKDWRFVMSVNLDGAFLGAKHGLKAMLESSRGQSSASIINISSAYGLVGGGSVAYDTSKGGITLLTKSLASECGEKSYNIRVNSIHPGAVNTNMENKDKTYTKEEREKLVDELCRKIPMSRFAEPSEIAEGVLFLASDAASFMTGSALVIDGGYTAV